VPLVAEDSNDVEDLYVLDLDTGDVALETARPGWADRMSGFLQPSISGDGRVITFRALSADPASPAGLGWQIVARDRERAAHQVITLGTAEADGNRRYLSAVVSADGATVVFESLAPRASGDGGAVQLSLVRLRTGATEAVSVAAGSGGAGHGVTPAVSADGRYIAFMSIDDLTCAPGSCPRATSRNRRADIYVRDTVAGRTSRVTQSASGGEPNGPSSWPSISADGRYVAFTSEASNLVRGDRNGEADVFVHDTFTGRTELISRSPAGHPGNAASRFAVISGDGHTVSFQSLASDLICRKRCSPADRDVNLVWDVFLFDRRLGTMMRVSNGATEWMARSRRPSLDHSGRVLVFSSRQPIDAADVMNDDDLYVWMRPGSPARINHAHR
jgi:Tol biopolymer transport system component